MPCDCDTTFLIIINEFPNNIIPNGIFFLKILMPAFHTQHKCHVIYEPSHLLTKLLPSNKTGNSWIQKSGVFDLKYDSSLLHHFVTRIRCACTCKLTAVQNFFLQTVLWCKTNRWGLTVSQLGFGKTSWCWHTSKHFERTPFEIVKTFSSSH